MASPSLLVLGKDQRFMVDGICDNTGKEVSTIDSCGHWEPHPAPYGSDRCTCWETTCFFCTNYFTPELYKKLLERRIEWKKEKAEIERQKEIKILKENAYLGYGGK